MMCARCEGLQAEVERLKEAINEDLANFQADKMANLRQIGRLKKELAQVREDDPENAQVRELLTFAREKLGKNTKWYIGMDGDRAKLAQRTLKRYGLERCKHTVIALAAKPYAGPRGRSESQYPGSKRFDDVDYCWGDDKRFTAMEQAYAEMTTPTLMDQPQGPPKLELVQNEPSAEIKARMGLPNWPDTLGGGRERRAELTDTLRLIAVTLKRWERREAA